MFGLKKIWLWSRKYLLLIILIVALLVILQWLYAYLPLFIEYAFSRLEAVEGKKVDLPKFLITWYDNISDTLTCLLVVGLSMIVLQFFRSIMRFISNYYQGALAQYIGYDLRLQIYDHTMDLSYSWHTHSDVGDLIQRSTTDVDQVSTFVSTMIPELINIFVTVAIGAYRVYQISPLLMWVSIAGVPISALSSIIYFRYCNKAFAQIEDSESKMTTIIQENVNNCRVVRAFANEKYEVEKLDRASLEFANKSRKFNTVMAFFWGTSDFITFLQYVVLICVGIVLAKNNALDTSGIIAALLLMGMVIWPMRSLGRIIASFGKSGVAAKRIAQILDEPSEYVHDGTLTPLISGNIEFKDVSFKFEDDNKNLLNGISLTIKAGQTVAIVGKTGSGKSTLCNLLTRMIDAQSGEILLDGVDIKQISKKYLRQNVKMVLQDPFLFSKTVYDNIAICDGSLKQEKVYEAAQTAAIHQEVMKFEKGYDTVVGEKGSTLSGGQKQRIAIARMLTSKCSILIFDDSLSALDTSTDLLIRQTLKQKDTYKTLIIITHRTTTAKEADLIVVLDSGKIVQMGNHEQLVAEEGLYKDLWGIQGQLEAEFKEILAKEA